MKTLSDTWFADGYIDFELKKYTLLAYLQEIHQHFGQNRLYPQLADIIFHYNNLVAFRENKKYLQEQVPKRLTGIQIEKLQVLYGQLIEDDELMQELEEFHVDAPERTTGSPTGAGHRPIGSNPEMFPDVRDWTANWARRNRCGGEPIEARITASVRQSGIYELC